MKKLLYSFLTLYCFISCTETDYHFIREDMFAIPEACHVEAIFANVGRISINEKYGTPEINDVSESVEAEYFHISVLTFDSIIGWNGNSLAFNTGIGQGYIPFAGMYCEDSIPEVEQHIHNWADEQNGSSRSVWDVSWENCTRTSCYHFPYRLEGVTAFSITANKRYNGIEAGGDLVDCFVISQFWPRLVFCYEDYSVCYQGLDTMTIANWLAMKPLASPCVLLRLTDRAMESATDISFTVSMTLTNGKTLTSTTPVINIAR